MKSMRDTIRIVENADFDHRHYAADELHDFNYKEFSDKGRGDLWTTGVYPRADQALADGPAVDEITIEVDENVDSIEPDPVQLDQLHQILNGELNATDQELRQGPVHLDSGSKQAVAGRLGVSIEDLEALINTLTQKLRDEQGDEEENKLLLTSLGEEYHRMMGEIEPPPVLQEAGYTDRPFGESQEPKKVNGWWYPGFQDPGPDHPLPVVSKDEADAERQAAAERVKKKRAQRREAAERTDEDRFTAEEPDSLGNMTVFDNQTGNSKFVQGGQATELRDKLATTPDKDAILGTLFEKASNPERQDDYSAEIAAKSGTYNFPWHLGPHHGFATAFFNEDHSLRLESVLDMTGEDIALDRLSDEQHEHLVQQAREFVDSGKV